MFVDDQDGGLAGVPDPEASNPRSLVEPQALSRDLPGETGAVPSDPGAFGRPLAIIFVARTVLNTAHRIIYPFLPSIARGLGLSLTAASMLITLRLVAGMTAPFLGAVADRHSRRRVMEVALLAFVLAGLLLVGGGTLATAVIAFALYGLAKVLYDPTVHAYLGDTVP